MCESFIGLTGCFRVREHEEQRCPVTAPRGEIIQFSQFYFHKVSIKKSQSTTAREKERSFAVIQLSNTSVAPERRSEDSFIGSHGSSDFVDVTGIPWRVPSELSGSNHTCRGNRNIGETIIQRQLTLHK